MHLKNEETLFHSVGPISRYSRQGDLLDRLHICVQLLKIPTVQKICNLALYEKIYVAATVKAIRYMYIISLQLLMRICHLKSIPSEDFPSVLFGCRDLYLAVREN